MDDKVGASDADSDADADSADDDERDELVGVALSSFYAQSLSKGDERKVHQFAQSALAAAVAAEPGSEAARFNELAAQVCRVLSIVFLLFVW